jgi:hypothetical protein
MKVIRRGGHYIVTDTINGLEVQEKFLVNSKKEAIKKFKEIHHLVFKNETKLGNVLS